MTNQAIILYHNMTQDEAIRAGESIENLRCSKTTFVDLTCSDREIKTQVKDDNRAFTEIAGQMSDRILLVFRRDTELVERLKTISRKLSSQQYELAGMSVWIANEINWPNVGNVMPLRCR